jgi:hypothetical protein
MIFREMTPSPSSSLPGTDVRRGPSAYDEHGFRAQRPRLPAPAAPGPHRPRPRRTGPGLPSTELGVVAELILVVLGVVRGEQPPVLPKLESLLGVAAAAAAAAATAANEELL